MARRKVQRAWLRSMTVRGEAAPPGASWVGTIEWGVRAREVRKHRKTGKPAGRPANDDTGLAQAVHVLEARGLSTSRAVLMIAKILAENTVTAKGGTVRLQAEIERVKKALRTEGRPTSR